eukprot:m.38057 g.38057  ORF g.38057 m.38057 type:complete len:52 (-) comp13275_c0_seq1:298-453(-)
MHDLQLLHHTIRSHDLRTHTRIHMREVYPAMVYHTTLSFNPRPTNVLPVDQ